ncbi:GNAT family N-acetyltransferase [Streptomyces sp. NPDC006879]|uniref:GNAT family N-acetyltransferase n=1 Tax=Streptomyces sp. NPDC006879 TaxID=3364767 RepID=UPI0036BEDAC3
MTTTLRPTGPLHLSDGAVRRRAYQICVNSRPVGGLELATDTPFGPSVGVIRSMWVEEPDRRRGRATVAALAAEEVLRSWRCTRIRVHVPADASAGLALAVALGYREQSRNMAKVLPAVPPALAAPAVSARPMTAREFDVWLARAQVEYARGWQERGMAPEEAARKSRNDHATQLPEGLDTPGASFTVLEHEGLPVGTVWVAESELRPGVRGSYVFDVAVDEQHRGQGHGRSLMLLAERAALGAGSTELGLHVYCDNLPALRLYESLGYRLTAVNLIKDIL